MSFVISKKESTEAIPLIVLHSVVKAAHDLNFEIHENIRKIVLEYHLYKDSKTFTDIELLKQLLENLTKNENFPAGIRIGEKLNLDLLPELEVFLSSCSTLRDAMQALVMAVQNLLPFYKIRTIESEKCFNLIVKISDGPMSNYSYFLIEALFSSIAKFGRAVAPDKFKLEKVIFSHRLNGSIREYRNTFNSNVFAGSTYNALVFPCWQMDAEFKNPMAKYNQKAREALQKKLEECKERQKLSDQVSKKFFLADELKKYNIETMSGLMNINKRTLQRRLQKEGYSFKTIASASKCELAKELLTHSSMPIEEISKKLGFSDRRSFTRAFQKISGLSPSKFRQNVFRLT